MNRELLVQYIEILNKMEDSPYDVRMSHSELDVSILEYIEEQATNDLELSTLLKELKSLPSSERMAHVNEYLKNKEENVQASENNEEDQIAKIFGIDVRDIQHLFLDSGSEIFCFYDSIMQRNIILENPKTGRSLLEQLEDIQEKNEKYQTENDSDNARDMMVEEVLQSNLELVFYSSEELNEHEEEIEKLNPDDRKKLKYLISHYDELMIKGINLENMIYLDQNGEIQEVTLSNSNEIVISSPTSIDNSNEKTTQAGHSSENSDLDSMFDDDNTMGEEIEEEIGHSVEFNKPKVLVKERIDDQNSGFTNNAFYLFLAFLIILIVIFVIIFVF